MKIETEPTFRELAFLVCTALDRHGVTAVLSGGGAATIYAPEAYQSRDLDFILGFWSNLGGASAKPLLELGFTEKRGSYHHPLTPFTVEFPPGPLAIGNEILRDWETLRERDLLLHILSPTDCVRDRLAWFLFGNDYSALEQALAVAFRHQIDMEKIEAWCLAEGEPRKFAIFQSRYAQGSS